MLDIVTLNGYKIKDEKAVRSYETVALMKADTKLKEGYHVKTKGYYEANDGGHGEYVIVDDETLVDDGGSIHVLNNGLRAKLIIENDTVNVKQFGAYGDGETDDTISIKNAINSTANTVLFSNETYVLSENINLKSKSYIGNETKINITTDTSREHFIRNENFNDITKNDNIILKNITFISNIGISILGLHSATLIMNNCKFYSTKTETHCLLDLYGNNKNCSITNCIFDINVEDGTERGSCIEIRGFTGGKSNNIIISNCKLSQNSLDESIWINAGVCGIENVIVDNCQINDTGNSANTIWISNSYSSTQPQPIKNVKVSNCDINKTVLADRLMTIGLREGNSDQTYIDTRNIVIDNCSIEIDERLSTATAGGTNLILYSRVQYDNHDLLISNCNINYKGENTINSAFNGTIRTNNNIISGANINYIYYKVYKAFKDLIITCKSVARDTFDIDSITVNASTNCFLEAADINHFLTSYLKNSSITCTSIINNSGAIRNRIYHITNNNINNSGTIFNNYSGDTSNKLYLMNNYIYSKNSLVNNQNCTLYIDNNYNNDGLIKGITGFNSYTLGSLVVGTVLFSSTSTKSIVRKISEGNTTDNWEEI